MMVKCTLFLIAVCKLQFIHIIYDFLDEKLLKMNKLLEILCNPNQRIPLETLLKCEIALEKMNLTSYATHGSSGSQIGSLKENQINNPLLEAVNSNLQSPIANHTLQRTFRPCIEALFGPDIKYENLDKIAQYYQ